MPSLHLLHIQNHLQLSSSPLSVSKKTSHGDFCDILRKRKAYPFPSCIVYARERDSQQFEVDPDKARQALQELDQQLESFSKKQINPPKMKVPEEKFTRTRMREEMPEISESFLSNTAVVLFIISIFYNVLFNAVIKPSIDGPGTDSITFDSEREANEPTFMQDLPLSSVLNSSSLLN